MPEPPNILLLVNDHQAHYRHGWDGGPLPQRPHFEQLASEGIHFERAYTCCPLCQPARRSLLTGVFPHVHGLLDNAIRPATPLETFLEGLAAADYELFSYGKWHASEGTAADYGCRGFSLPGYGNPYVSDAYRAYLQARRLPQAEHRIERNFWKHWEHLPTVPGGRYRCEQPHWCNEHMTGLTTTPKETHEAFFLAELARDGLQQLARAPSRRPFFLRVDFWGPHQPHFPTREFADLYDPESIPVYGSFHDTLDDKPDIYRQEINWPLFDENHRLIRPNPLNWSEWQRVIARCYAHITMVDAAGGLVLDALQTCGLADNTLVIWTADHGDALACHGGHFDKFCYMPEEMIRIPMAMRWPGVIAPGSATDRLVSLLDICPTLLDAAGAGVRHAMQGASLLPLSCGREDAWRCELLCETHGNWNRSIAGRALITARHKYIATENDRDELYDLRCDPFELHNLVDAPHAATLKHDMRKRLAEHQASVGDAVSFGHDAGPVNTETT